MCGMLLSHFPSLDRVEFAAAALQHRGSDKPTYAHNVPSGAGWTLIHARLPIQDFAGKFSPQPYILSAGGQGGDPCVVGFVGEIFNSVDTGRTEISYLMEAMADETMFAELDGFWSVIRIDYRTGRAYAYTDFLGIKPLYYWEARGMVGSEIQPMLELVGPGLAPEKDEVHLSNVIKWGYDHSGRTPFKGIRQLPPGTVIELGPDGRLISERVYWDWGRVPSAEVVNEQKADALSLLRLLSTSVRRRVEGCHPGNRVAVNLLLSGGLDSSILYYLLKQIGRTDDINLLHYENQDDGDYLPNAPITRIAAPKNPSEKNLSAAVFALESPMDLGSVLPQYNLAEALSLLPDHRVVLTGDGADELFGGYSRAMDYDSQASDVFCELPYYHLPRLDKMHMRFTTEVRSPFLSPAVIKFALQLPRPARTGKTILKRVAELAGVPRPVIDRKKVALKSNQVRDDAVAHRVSLNGVFHHVFQ